MNIDDLEESLREFDIHCDEKQFLKLVTNLKKGLEKEEVQNNTPW